MVRDVAMTMVNHAIDLVKQTGDEHYYVDFYKLHKLLYFAHGYMLAKYRKPLFGEDVELRSCGPFIPALLELPLEYEEMKTPIRGEEIFPLTQDRVEAIDHVLTVYGRLTRDELTNKAKQDPLYRRYAQEASKNRKLSIADFQEYGAAFLIDQ